MLPGLSGETLVQTLRVQHVAIPIVVMSAKSEVSDRIDVLRLGADDYLVKPFDLDELVARVEVQLRHHAGSSLPEPYDGRYLWAVVCRQGCSYVFC